MKILDHINKALYNYMYFLGLYLKYDFTKWDKIPSVYYIITYVNKYEAVFWDKTNIRELVCMCMAKNW